MLCDEFEICLVSRESVGRGSSQSAIAIAIAPGEERAHPSSFTSGAEGEPRP